MLFAGAFAASFLFAHDAMARLTGDATLSYTSYDGRSSTNHVSSRSFTQNYSLLYSSSGPIYNSRVGYYDVALGYNWTALDSTVKSAGLPNDNYNETRGHLMYNGEIKLDPKEVPFKLTAYSRDMTRNSFTGSGSQYIDDFRSVLGARDLATGINDGLHIESGATLIAGVKNGMTNGYNEFLRHFPMILVDYKDTLNKDLRSQTPVDERLSRLAFVSLNKKDNWFHYRHTLYADNLNTKNNYVENEVQIGTVDQELSRRWIDFSNWLKVSTDLQLSKRKTNYMDHSIEDINLNLFVAAERKFWNAKTFATFNRNMDENQKLSYLTSLPVYASGTVSQDLSWDARTSFRTTHDTQVSGASTRFVNSLVGYRVEAYKRALFTLTQGADVEVSDTDTDRLVTISGNIETISSPRFSRAVTLAASYKIKNSATSSDMTASTNFLEQSLELRGGYVPTNTLRFEVRQNSTFTRGSYSTFSSTARDSGTLLPQFVNPRGFSSSADTGTAGYHSVSNVLLAWNPKPRLNTSLSLTEDIYKSELQGTSAVTLAQSDISYANESWNVSNSFKYSHGSREGLDDNANTITDNAMLRYTHSRSLDVSASAAYSEETQSNGKTVRGSEYVQRLNYYRFSKSGVARKLFEFNETLTYTDGIAVTSSTNGKSLTLGLKYYPISQLTLATGVGYSYDTTLSNYTMVWNAAAVANFRLLQDSLEYIHGLRKSDGLRENKLTGSIRKSF